RPSHLPLCPYAPPSRPGRSGLRGLAGAPPPLAQHLVRVLFFFVFREAPVLETLAVAFLRERPPLGDRADLAVVEVVLVDIVYRRGPVVRRLRRLDVPARPLLQGHFADVAFEVLDFDELLVLVDRDHLEQGPVVYALVPVAGDGLDVVVHRCNLLAVSTANRL